MRILFTAVPYWGHVTPLLPLARAFARAGADVSWATGEPAAQRLREEGFVAHTAGETETFRLTPVLLSQEPEIAALPPRERPERMFGRIFGRGRTAPMLADLLPIMSAEAPDLVVRDMAEFAAPIAAAVHAVPCLTHSLGALLPATRIAAAGADVASLWEERGLSPRPYGGSYDDLYLDIYPPALQAQGRAHVPRTQRLRSVPLPTGVVAPHPWPGAADRPLVYVTFGTVFNEYEPLRRVVEGVRDLDVSVIVTVGPDRDPGVLGVQPDNVRVTRFVPQDDLLPHCAAVVSHAGSGTFLGAAAHGLPQVCVPQGADQFLNADACAASGIGLVVPDEASAVRNAVERVVSDSAFALAAKHVKTALEDMPSPREVAALLIDRYARA